MFHAEFFKGLKCRNVGLQSDYATFITNMNDNDGIGVAQQTASNNYVKFIYPVQQVFNLSLQSSPTFYEVIHERKPCTLYFDIDHGSIDEILPELIVTVKENLVSDHGINVEHLTLQSADDKKCTFHVIFPFVVFNSVVEVKNFVGAMRGEAKRFVDMHVYGKNKIFRFLYSSKFGERRPLLVDLARSSRKLVNLGVRDVFYLSVLTFPSTRDRVSVHLSMVPSVSSPRNVSSSGHRLPDVISAFVKTVPGVVYESHHDNVVTRRAFYRFKNFQCPYAGRIHRNNKPQIVLNLDTKEAMYIVCHSSACVGQRMEVATFIAQWCQSPVYEEEDNDDDIFRELSVTQVVGKLSLDANDNVGAATMTAVESDRQSVIVEEKFEENFGEIDEPSQKEDSVEEKFGEDVGKIDEPSQEEESVQKKCGEDVVRIDESSQEEELARTSRKRRRIIQSSAESSESDGFVVSDNENEGDSEGSERGSDSDNEEQVDSQGSERSSGSSSSSLDGFVVSDNENEGDSEGSERGSDSDNEEQVDSQGSERSSGSSSSSLSNGDDSIPLESDSGPTHFEGESDGDEYSDDPVEFVPKMPKNVSKEKMSGNNELTEPVKKRARRSEDWLVVEMRQRAELADAQQADKEQSSKCEVSTGNVPSLGDSGVDSESCSKWRLDRYDALSSDDEERNKDKVGDEELGRTQIFSNRITEVARETFRIESLTVEQEQCIMMTLRGENVLLILPTGAGKSVTFQVPALISKKLTVVFSPLVALLRSQVHTLSETLKVQAVGICGGTSAKIRSQIYMRLKPGTDLALLYTTPESLSADTTLQLSLYKLAREGGICNVVFDEAHCMITWGSSFRPTYKSIIPEVLSWKVPITMCTATASPAVTAEFRQLFPSVTFAEIRKTIFRANLHFRVIPKDTSLGDRLFDLLQKYDGQCSIIYCRTVKRATDIATLVGGTAYHAQLSSRRREEIELEWASGKVPRLVCTEAFGLGMHYDAIRFVMFETIPQGLDQLLQIAGRAGRDGKDAEIVIAYADSEYNQIARLVTRNNTIGLMKDALVAVKAFCISRDCRYVFLMSQYNESGTTKCGKCDNCQDEEEMKKSAADHIKESSRARKCDIARFNDERSNDDENVKSVSGFMWRKMTEK